MYTHGDGGGFWSVAKKGAMKAAEDLGVTFDYQASNNDPAKQAQLIEAGVSAGCQGIAVSARNPDAIKGALGKATAAGIPIVTMNSGSAVFADLVRRPGRHLQERGRDPGQAGVGEGHRRHLLPQRRHRHRCGDPGRRGCEPWHQDRHRRPLRRRSAGDQGREDGVRHRPAAVRSTRCAPAGASRSGRTP